MSHELEVDRDFLNQTKNNNNYVKTDELDIIIF